MVLENSIFNYVMLFIVIIVMFSIFAFFLGDSANSFDSGSNEQNITNLTMQGLIKPVIGASSAGGYLFGGLAILVILILAGKYFNKF